MNEQQLTEFLTFCKQAIPEYKDLSLEQIAESLVQIQESDPETFQGILNSYKKAKQAFKRGGKLDVFVAKFANGGKSTKKCSCGCDLVKVAEKGGIVEKCACGCKNKVVKAQDGSPDGLIKREQQPKGIRGIGFEGRLKMHPYPSKDGIERTVNELVTAKGDTITNIQGPYTHYRRESSPSGKITILETVGSNPPIVYSNKGLFTKKITPGLEDMFKDIRKIFK